MSFWKTWTFWTLLNAWTYFDLPLIHLHLDHVNKHFLLHPCKQLWSSFICYSQQGRLLHLHLSCFNPFRLIEAFKFLFIFCSICVYKLIALPKCIYPQISLCIFHSSYSLLKVFQLVFLFRQCTKPLI